MSFAMASFIQFLGLAPKKNDNTKNIRKQTHSKRCGKQMLGLKKGKMVEICLKMTHTAHYTQRPLGM